MSRFHGVAMLAFGSTLVEYADTGGRGWIIAAVVALAVRLTG